LSMEQSLTYLPKPGYLRRMHLYWAEMFPLPKALLTAMLQYIGFNWMLCRIHGVQLSLLSPFALVGIWTTFGFLLILRLMDELKDKEIDLALFRDRPVPSGRVLESDIRFSLVAMISLMLAANLWAGRIFLASVGLLCYALLMFEYFFIPNVLRKYLLLNLAIHNPFTALVFLYVTVLFSEQYHLSLHQINWSSVLIVILTFWAMVFAWEISRKIRSGEEENDYVTYSQLLGRVGSVIAAAGAQTLTFLLALHFYYSLSMSRAFAAILVIGYAATMYGHVRFLVRPDPITSRLKPFAERYILCVLFAFVVDLILTY